MFEHEYLENHAWWEERAGFHPTTDFYQPHIQSLRSGGITLHEPELAEVGDVAGKQLLHLQCHIGTGYIGLAGSEMSKDCSESISAGFNR